MSIWKQGKWASGDFTENDTRYRIALRDERGKRIPYTDDPASKHYEKAIRAEGEPKKRRKMTS